VTANGGLAVRSERDPAACAAVWRRPCRVQHCLAPRNSAIPEEPQGWNAQARGRLITVGALPSAHPARSKPRAGFRQRRAGHRSRRSIPAFPRRRRPCPAITMAARRARAPHRHLRPRRPGRGGGRPRRAHRGPPDGARDASGSRGRRRRERRRERRQHIRRPAVRRSRRWLPARLPRRRLRGRRDRRRPHAVAAPGRGVARGGYLARAAPRRAGARLRGLAHLRHGRARRAAPLAAPGRRAERRRGARSPAGRHDHPLLRRRAAQ